MKLCSMCKTEIESLRNLKYCKDCKRLVAIIKGQRRTESRKTKTSICVICEKHFDHTPSKARFTCGDPDCVRQHKINTIKNKNTIKCKVCKQEFDRTSNAEKICGKKECREASKKVQYYKPEIYETSHLKEFKEKRLRRVKKYELGMAEKGETRCYYCKHERWQCWNCRSIDLAGRDLLQEDKIKIE